MVAPAVIRLADDVSSVDMAATVHPVAGVQAVAIPAADLPAEAGVVRRADMLFIITITVLVEARADIIHPVAPQEAAWFTRLRFTPTA
jgi:hypothetical protein